MNGSMFDLTSHCRNVSQSPDPFNLAEAATRCRSRKSHPRGFAPEGESGQHPKRCLPSSICLRCSSPICSNRGGSWKSRTSFFVTSSTSPSGVHRAVCGCVGATGRCWYGCHGFGQACLGRPGSLSLTRYCGGIEQDFAPIGAGNPVLGQGGLRLAVSCANSSIGWARRTLCGGPRESTGNY